MKNAEIVIFLRGYIDIYIQSFGKILLPLRVGDASSQSLNCLHYIQKQA